jgi:hypothetical protein
VRARQNPRRLAHWVRNRLASTRGAAAAVRVAPLELPQKRRELPPPSSRIRRASTQPPPATTTEPLRRSDGIGVCDALAAVLCAPQGAQGDRTCGEIIEESFIAFGSQTRTRDEQLPFVDSRSTRCMVRQRLTCNYQRAKSMQVTGGCEAAGDQIPRRSPADQSRRAEAPSGCQGQPKHCVGRVRRSGRHRAPARARRQR